MFKILRLDFSLVFHKFYLFSKRIMNVKHVKHENLSFYLNQRGEHFELYGGKMKSSSG